MKFKYFKIGLMVCFFFGINVCYDELDIVDFNCFLNEFFYENVDQVVVVVDVIYNVFIIDGMYQWMMLVYNDGWSDEFFCCSLWVFLIGLSNFIVFGMDVVFEIFWVGYYIMVFWVNQVLENIFNIEMDEGFCNWLLGQVYFLCVLVYFNLINVYENVLFIFEMLKGGDFYYFSNEGVICDMVYSQVKLDLEIVIGLLLFNYNSVEGFDQGQFGCVIQGVVQLLFGKVFFFEGNYLEAGCYFEAVINFNEYVLGNNYFDLFIQDLGLENSNLGKIFWVDFMISIVVEFNWGGDFNVNWCQFLAIMFMYLQGDFYDFYVMEFLYNEMWEELMIDGILDFCYYVIILFYELDEGYMIVYGVDWFERGYIEIDFFIKKYINVVIGLDVFVFGFDYYIICYVDVLLMYVECLVNMGDVVGVVGYVQ